MTTTEPELVAELDRFRGHSLTPDVEVPALYSNEPVEGAACDINDTVIHVEYTVPGTRARWLIAEFDPAEGLMFGYCDLGVGFPEWGYVSLSELAELNVYTVDGLAVAVRTLDWTPTAFRNTQN